MGASRVPVSIALAISLVCLVARIVAAPQTPATVRLKPDPTSSERPRFEVASIKPNVSNDGQVMIQRTGTRYTARGVSLALMIRNAYDVQDSQIIGVPGWAESDRFDIVATMPQAAQNALPDGTRQAQMLQSLLAERFKLSMHDETREMPVYGLVLARTDRKLGPQLRASSVDCAAAIAARARGGAAPAPPPPGELAPCSSTVGPGFVQGRSRTMADLATSLSRLTNTGSSLGRLIVDRTGLAGSYDFDLRFTPDRIPNFESGGPPPSLPDIDPNGASIYAAMQEQLGLKLEAQRAPVRVLVIDRVEKPQPD